MAHDTFHGLLKLREEIDMRALKTIVENFPIVYERLGNEFWKLNRETGEYEKTDAETAKTIMEDLFKQKRKTKLVEYHYSGRTHSGRRFASNSLQGISRKLRHTLAKNIYYDLDMANAHPTFLHELCKTLGFTHRVLEEYILHRPEKLNSWLGVEVSEYDKDQKKVVRKTLTERDEVKKYFLKMVNGGGGSDTSCAELNEFYMTHQMFLTKFYNTKAFERFAKRAKRRAEEKKQQFGENTYVNPKGTAINYYFCEEEDKVLTYMEEFLTKQHIEYGTLCFDGLQIYQRDVSNLQETIQGMEAFLLEKLQYPIQIKHKEMDEGIDLSDLPVSDQAEELRIVENDKQAGELLYEELKDTLIYSNNTYYHKTGLLWRSGETDIVCSVRQYVMNADLYRLNAKGEPQHYSQKLSYARDITTVILDKVRANRNDDWFNGISDSSNGKVLFRNGYYDMVRGQFIHKDSDYYDTSIVFMEEISHEYDETLMDPEYQKSISHRLFMEPFGDVIGYQYLLHLARGLAWDKQKKMMVGMGRSNGGKSLLSLGMEMAMGGYFGTFNGANLRYKNSSQDEGQKLRWLGLLGHKRIIVSHELQVGGMGIDGNMLKKIANGGQENIVYREHGGNETAFKFGGLCIIYCQDLDRIQPMDDAVKTRLRVIPYDKVYVENPSNNMELPIDRNLPAEVRTPMFRMNFIQLLFDIYTSWVMGGRTEEEPEEMKEAVQDIAVDDDDDIMRPFLEEFELTNNEEDVVKSSDIKTWLENNKQRITMAKFAVEMKRYLKIHPELTNIRSKAKKIGGKTGQCWMGMRRIPEVQE